MGHTDLFTETIKIAKEQGYSSKVLNTKELVMDSIGPQIIIIYVQGNAYYFMDTLSLEEKQKCEEVAAEYRKDDNKHEIEEYLETLYTRYGIELFKVKISMCQGF